MKGGELMDFTKHFATRLARLVTPQARARSPDTPQVPNSAGGYAWPVDQWTRLDRFLSSGQRARNVLHPRARSSRSENATSARRVHGRRTGRAPVRRIVEISAAGRAPNNDPALFALAMCAGLGDDATRAMALEALPRGGAHGDAPVPLPPVRPRRSADGGVACGAPSAAGTRRSRRRPSRTRCSSTRRGTGGRTATLCVSPTRRRRPSRTTCCSATPRRGGTACWSSTG